MDSKYLNEPKQDYSVHESAGEFTQYDDLTDSEHSRWHVGFSCMTCPRDGDVLKHSLKAGRRVLFVLDKVERPNNEDFIKAVITAWRFEDALSGEERNTYEAARSKEQTLLLV